MAKSASTAAALAKKCSRDAVAKQAQNAKEASVGFDDIGQILHLGKK